MLLLIKKNKKLAEEKIDDFKLKIIEDIDKLNNLIKNTVESQKITIIKLDKTDKELKKEIQQVNRKKIDTIDHDNQMQNMATQFNQTLELMKKVIDEQKQELISYIDKNVYDLRKQIDNK